MSTYLLYLSFVHMGAENGNWNGPEVTLAKEVERRVLAAWETLSDNPQQVADHMDTSRIEALQRSVNHVEPEPGHINFDRLVSGAEDAGGTTEPIADAISPEMETPKKSHLVKKGDTLWRIAVDNHTTVDAIMKANPDIKDRSKIYPGDRIWLPNVSGNPHSEKIINTKTVLHDNQDGREKRKQSDHRQIPDTHTETVGSVNHEKQAERKEPVKSQKPDKKEQDASQKPMETEQQKMSVLDTQPKGNSPAPSAKENITNTEGVPQPDWLGSLPETWGEAPKQTG